MRKWLVERSMPGIGDFTQDELAGVSARSCEVLAGMPTVQWLEGFVTPDKLYCVMLAPTEQAVRDHGARAGFPVDSVSQVSQVIDPSTPDSWEMSRDDGGLTEAREVGHKRPTIGS